MYKVENSKLEHLECRLNVSELSSETFCVDDTVFDYYRRRFHRVAALKNFEDIQEN